VNKPAWLAWIATVLAAHATLLTSLPLAPIVPLAGVRGPAIAVTFVQTLEPTAPPAPPAGAAAPRPAPRPATATLREAIAPPSMPASAPTGPLAPEPLQAQAPGVVSTAPAQAESPTVPPGVVDWPPSTRLVYRVLGEFRGPAEGEAEVQWRRSEDRYEVLMNLHIGPGFAPLASRTVRSEGLITAEGLAPRRYEEETRALFTEPRRLAIELAADGILLPSGQRVARPAGVQDSASQFVQLTWMFTVDPGRLVPGQVLELPLALPRRVEPWLFDVVGPETLFLAPGAVETVHVKPRREARPGGDLTAEVWIAPSLQYLPVRILIRQSAQTWLDLTLQTWPQQAAAPR
jgi:hypothetical protein